MLCPQDGAAMRKRMRSAVWSPGLTQYLAHSRCSMPGTALVLLFIVSTELAETSPSSPLWPPPWTLAVSPGVPP